MKVKRFSQDDGKSYKVIIEEDGDADASEQIIINSDGVKKEKAMVFISTDSEKPMMIVDGKEITEGTLNDISPDKIEKVEVLKGEKAAEKYGEKGKNGVIIITTKQ
jgi:TonB-dependent SusC/RagA subfamily outer membrane receptor